MRKKRVPVLLIIFIILIHLSVAAYGTETDKTQQINVYVNDTKIEFDVEPIFINNRVMVPIRAVFEAMGAAVEWDGNTKTVKVSRGINSIEVKLDNKIATVDGKTVIMEVPAVGIDGRVLVPLRFFGEALKANVEWVNYTKTAFIKDIPTPSNSSNLQNLGKFASDDEFNYYILQDNTLIRENLNSNKQEKISDHIVCDLHIYKDWIYCIGLDKGIEKVMRLKKDGTEKQVIIDERVPSIKIVNDWIYYGDPNQQTTLCRTKADGSETMEITKDGDFSPRNWLVQDGWIYYQNTNTKTINRVRIDGSEETVLTSLYVYPTSSPDSNTKNTGLKYSIKLIDREYIYLVLNSEGLNTTDNKPPGVYRVPVGGGKPQLIIDKVPLSINMDDDWLYMAVKNEISSQLIKCRKDGSEVYTINEYKVNDIPVSIYVDKESVYYSLLRGKEELLFRMSSNGEKVTSFSWIYSEDYEKVREVLSAVSAAHDSLNSLTLLQKSELDDGQQTSNIIYERKVLKSGSLYYQRDIEERTKMETWVVSNNIYRKKPEDNQWSIIENGTDQNIALKTVFSYIRPDGELCNNLNISEKGNTIHLYGTGSFPNLMKELINSSELTYNTETDFFQSVTVDIKINKNSQLIEELSLEIRFTPARTGEQELISRYKYSGSGYNSTLLYVPESLFQSANAKKQAGYYIEQAMQKMQSGNLREAIQVLDKAIALYNKSHMAYLYKGNALYNLGNYEEAILTYEQYHELMPSDVEVLALQGLCYFKLDDLNKAEQLAKRVIEVNENSITALNLLGSVLMDREENQQAYELFKRAVSIDNRHFESHFNLVLTLYNTGSYTKCIHTVDEFLARFPDNRELMYLKAQSLSKQGKPNEAISVYEQILDMNPANDFVTMTYIAIEYEKLQNYTTAQEYANRAKAVYPDYSLLKNLLERLIYERSTSSSQKLVDFIRENYLFFKRNEEITNAFKSITSKLNSYTIDDVQKLLEIIKNGADNTIDTTYVLSGKDYEIYINRWDNYLMETKQDNKAVYVKIKTFWQEIGIKFTEYIQSIENPEDKALILDLRDNDGGLSAEASVILDALLPECTPGYLTERDGFITYIKSGKSYAPFRKIGILVNENTASSAELLALSLKIYGNNVTIIGSNTMGVGVGQTVYLDRMKKYAVFLTNHYWDVIKGKIEDQGVPIDIKVSGGEFDQAVADFLRNN
jgi:tetratricopeptide (TPR) repeat protein